MQREIERSVEFTRIYRENAGASAALREARCLAAQFPGVLAPLALSDTVAGNRRSDEIAYIGSIRWMGFPGWTPERRVEGKQGGYCFDFAALPKLAETATPEELAALSELSAFWQKESTIGRYQAEGSETDRVRRIRCAAEGNAIGFCMAHDFDKLVRLGLPGLARALTDRLARAARESDAEGADFCRAGLLALDAVRASFRWYREQAETFAREAPEAEQRRHFARMAADLAHLDRAAPETFTQGVHLVWLYNLMASGRHIEWDALDVALGDMYARSLDSGDLTEEEAIAFLCGFFRQIHFNGDDAVCRMTVGGAGRRNPEQADRFALSAMEASRRVHLVTPQLTLRFHAGQNPELLRRAYAIIGQGGVYPMLYNDDVILPGVQKSLRLTPEESVNYFPLGCGEYMLAHSSPSMLNLNWNIPRLLDAVLHNGRSPDGERIGEETGPVESFTDFETLVAAVIVQARASARIGARHYRLIRELLAQTAPFLLSSLLTEDCIGRARGLFNGGLRKVGACLMGHGYTNLADSLAAIRTVVYEQGVATLAEVRDACDRNFEGAETLRRRLLAAPKFGNDDAAADRLFHRLWEELNRAAADAGAAEGFDFFTASCVNPGGYWMGETSGATPDGRRAHEPFAIGNAPSSGQDRRGLTALCNTIAGVDAACGGATTNFKLSHELFSGDPSPAEMIFTVFFRKGGQQATISTVRQTDLLEARQHPEAYSHIIVRVGGWCARFIDLEPTVQDDVIRRTFYGG